MGEIIQAVDAIVLQDGQNPAFRSYVYSVEDYLYFIATEDRPLPETLTAGITHVTDVLVMEPSKEYNLCKN